MQLPRRAFAPPASALRYFPIVAVLCVSGCASYTPSSLPHTYVTNTQQPYATSGFRIISAPPDTITGVAQQVLFLEKIDIRVFVNGQVALVANAAKSNQTIIPLPPGQHIVAIQLVSQSVLSLGFKIPIEIQEYAVTIPQGQLVEAQVIWEHAGSGSFGRDAIGRETTVNYLKPGFIFSGAASSNQLR